MSFLRVILLLLLLLHAIPASFDACLELYSHGAGGVNTCKIPRVLSLKGGGKRASHIDRAREDEQNGKEEEEEEEEDSDSNDSFDPKKTSLQYRQRGLEAAGKRQEEEVVSKKRPAAEAEACVDDGKDEDKEQVGSSVTSKKKKKKRQHGADHWAEDAEDGDATAQYELALCFSTGKGCQQNENRSSFWFEKAAKQGHVKANYEFGRRLLSGLGLKKCDKVTASEHFRRAAEAGDVEACVARAWCLFSGVGCSQDKQEAANLYKFAASRGSARAGILQACTRKVTESRRINRRRSTS